MSNQVELAPRGGLRLYELPGVMQQLQDVLDLLPGEATYDEARAVIAAQMDAEQDTLEDKLAGIAYVIRNLIVESEACADEAARMAARAQSAKNRADHLKQYAKSTMETLGQLKVDCGPGRPRLSVQKNGGGRRLEIDDSKLGEWFYSAFEKAKLLRNEADEIERENKAALRSKLEAGEVVSGAVLHERGTHLVIR